MGRHLSGLRRTGRQNDLIWVIMDRFTKSSNFIPTKSTFKVEEYAIIYIIEIVSLHGIRFTSREHSEYLTGVVIH